MRKPPIDDVPFVLFPPDHGKVGRGIMGFLILATVALAASILWKISSRRRLTALRKETFERTNAYGVREYRDFDEKERVRKRWHWVVWADEFSTILVIVTGAVLAATIAALWFLG